MMSESESNPRKYRSTIIRVMDLLAYIAYNDKVNSSKIVTRCNHSWGKTKNSVDGLEQNGYIRKIVNDSDGTCTEHYFVITEKGLILLKQYEKIKDQLIELEICR